MKKLFNLIVKFFKKLFGIKDKEEQIQNPQEEQENKCPEYLIHPKRLECGLVRFNVKEL